MLTTEQLIGCQRVYAADRAGSPTLCLIGLCCEASRETYAAGSRKRTDTALLGILRSETLEALLSARRQVVQQLLRCQPVCAADGGLTNNRA